MSVRELFTVILYGAAASALISVVYTYLKKAIYIPLNRKKLLKKAVKDGHVVKAHLVKQYSDLDNSGKRYGEYQYEYEGKTYKYTGVTFNRSPGEEVTLYFIKRPECASIAEELGLGEGNGIKLFIILTLVLSGLMIFSRLS